MQSIVHKLRYFLRSVKDRKTYMSAPWGVVNQLPHYEDLQITDLEGLFRGSIVWHVIDGKHIIFEMPIFATGQALDPLPRCHPLRAGIKIYSWESHDFSMYEKTSGGQTLPQHEFVHLYAQRRLMRVPVLHGNNDFDAH